MKNIANILLSIVLLGTCRVQAQEAKPESKGRMDNPTVAAPLQTPRSVSPKLRDGRLYGWFLASYNAVPDWGLASFSPENPDEDWVIEVSHDWAPLGAAVVDGIMYGQMASVGISSYDVQTWSRFNTATWSETVLANIENMQVSYIDMTYDYSTKTMFALVRENAVTDLYSVNLTTGQPTFVTHCDSSLVALAADIKGQLYAVTMHGWFVKLQKQTGGVEPIGFTGEPSPGNYIQSMDIDLTDGVCYWAVSSLNGDYLARIDMQTGQMEDLGPVSVGVEITGLYASTPCGGGAAPDAVDNLVATTVREDGAGTSVELSFTAPTGYAALSQTLSSISKIEIYRDYELVHTITDATPGQSITWIDEDYAALQDEDVVGYRVVAYNDAGAGFSTCCAATVGEDIPGPVSNLRMEVADDSVVTLTWNAPTEGLNGGWFNPDAVYYEVVRYPDETVVASRLQETTFTETLSQGCNYYWYTVRSYSFKGRGQAVESEGARVGTALALPYACSFNTAAEGFLWEVVDANTPIPDGVTWEHYLNEGMEGTQGYLHYGRSTNSDGNDYAYSAPFRRVAGEHYRLRFDLASTGDASTSEDMEVLLIAEDGTETLMQAYEDFNTRYEFQTMRVALPVAEPAGEGLYTIAFRATSPRNQSGIQVDNVILDYVIDAPVTGTVEDEAGNPLEGVCVAVAAADASYRDTVYTNAEGQYDLGYLDEASYTLVFSYFGYEDRSESISVEALQPVVRDVTMQSRQLLTLSGLVEDEYGDPVPGVSVYMTGYQTYSAQTGADGRYTIEDVYRHDGAYSMVFFKSRYQTVRDTVSMALETRSKDLSLPFLRISAENFTATPEGENMLLQWEKAEDMQEFRYDNGTFAGAAQLRNDSASGILYTEAAFGTIYYQPMELRSVKWWMSSEGGTMNHTTADISIYAVDPNPGRGFGALLFRKEGVPSTDDQWSEYVLDYPVEITAGCMIMIGSSEGNIAIGVDNGTDPDYPFQTQRHGVTTDWSNVGSLATLEDWGILQNLMIRAIGVPEQEQGKQAKAAEDNLDIYNIYRLAQGQEENRDSWTQVAEGLRGVESYRDEDWSSLERGGYLYALANVYGEDEAEAVFSNVVGKDMITEVTVLAKTNTTPDEIEGAVASLTNTEFPEYTYQGTFGTDGRLVFDSVWKGTYSLSISKSLFDGVEEEVDFSTENAYTTQTYEIKERIVDPYSLYVETSSTDYRDKTLFWNVDETVSEDCEAMPDFEINPEGEFGWTYLDGDGAETYGMVIGQDVIDWPGIYEPHAFIVMNPYETTPAIYTSLNTSHSGRRALMNMRNLDVENPVQKDDWIFSPELHFETPYVFSFWAVSGMESLAETIQVGYSTTTTEPSAFTWLEDELVIPGAWYQYSYTIPAEARYVTIHVISQGEDSYFLMLDDLYIGPEPSAERPDNSRALHYEIYLDGTQVATVEGVLTYNFDDLSDGTHTAGVVSVYQTGKSQMKTVEFMVDPSIIANEDAALASRIRLYPNPATENVNVQGDYDEAWIFDMSGRLVAKLANEQVIDVSGLRPGVYFVRFAKDGAFCVKKVVKL